MAETSIEWTRGDDGTAGKTWNPAVTGCSMISPGCTNCYAMKQAHRFSGPTGHARYRGLTVLGKQGPRWTGEVRVGTEAIADPLGWRKPRRVFVNSMTDLFHEDVPNETIAAVFGVMAATPRHTYQILTKRAGRLPRWFKWLGERDPGRTCGDYAEVLGAPVYVKSRDGRSPWNDYACVWPLPNVWLGVSIESPEYLWRLEHLRAALATVRFVSLEPLLADLGEFDATGIDWGIVGGESGPGARPCDVEWIARAVGRLRAAGAAPFVKQMGAYPVDNSRPSDFTIGPDRVHMLKDPKGGDPAEWPAGDWPREFP